MGVSLLVLCDKTKKKNASTGRHRYPVPVVFDLDERTGNEDSATERTTGNGRLDGRAWNTSTSRSVSIECCLGMDKLRKTSATDDNEVNGE